MTKKQIETMDALRNRMLRICTNNRSCRKCPLIIDSTHCVGRYLAATYQPKCGRGRPTES